MEEWNYILFQFLLFVGHIRLHRMRIAGPFGSLWRISVTHIRALFVAVCGVDRISVTHWLLLTVIVLVVVAAMLIMMLILIAGVDRGRRWRWIRCVRIHAVFLHGIVFFIARIPKVDLLVGSDLTCLLC